MSALAGIVSVLAVAYLTKCVGLMAEAGLIGFVGGGIAGALLGYCIHKVREHLEARKYRPTDSD